MRYGHHPLTSARKPVCIKTLLSLASSGVVFDFECLKEIPGEGVKAVQPEGLAGKLLVERLLERLSENKGPLVQTACGCGGREWVDGEVEAQRVQHQFEASS